MRRRDLFGIELVGGNSADSAVLVQLFTENGANLRKLYFRNINIIAAIW